MLPVALLPYAGGESREEKSGQREKRFPNHYRASTKMRTSLQGTRLNGGGPVDAQTPTPQHGFKAGYVAAVGSGEVLLDQMDNFKKYAKRVLAAVAEEPGTLAFEFSVQPDGKTVDLLEIYQNAEAFVAHASRDA